MVVVELRSLIDTQSMRFLIIEYDIWIALTSARDGRYCEDKIEPEPNMTVFVS